MDFKDEILNFTDESILTEYGGQVMMNWESPIMEKAAQYICHNKGDVLEIGFGMGICADYIQAQGVNSHTIIEIHPQILEKLNTWANGKSNVTIIEGDWANLSLTDTYDGIFIDTYGDENVKEFKEFSLSKIKDSGLITYWNNHSEPLNELEFENITFEEVAVNPVENRYFNNSVYYMPKVVK